MVPAMACVCKSRFNQSINQSDSEQRALVAGPACTKLGRDLLSETALAASLSRALSIDTADGAAAGDDTLIASSSLLLEARLVLALGGLDASLLGLGLIDQVALAAAAIMPDALLSCDGLLVVVARLALELVKGGLARGLSVLLVLDVTGTATASGNAAGS